MDGGGSYSINNDLIAPIKHVPTTLEKSFAPSKLLYICCGEAEAGGPTDRPVNWCKLFAHGTFYASAWWSTLHGCYDRKYSDRSSRLHTYSMRELVGLLKGRLWNPYVVQSFLISETCQTSKLELLNQIWCIVINGIQDDSSVSHEYLLEIYYRRTRYQIHTLTHKKFQALLVAGAFVLYSNSQVKHFEQFKLWSECCEDIYR